MQTLMGTLVDVARSPIVRVPLSKRDKVPDQTVVRSFLKLKHEAIGRPGSLSNDHRVSRLSIECSTSP